MFHMILDVMLGLLLHKLMQYFSEYVFVCEVSIETSAADFGGLKEEKKVE